MTMRIDGHTHIFTLYSILSRQAIRVIEARLKRKLDGKGVPDALIEALGDVLHDQLNRPEYMDERRLLQALVDKLKQRVGLAALPSSIDLGDNGQFGLDADLDGLATSALRTLIGKLLSIDGGPLDKVLDVLDTFRLSMQPTITDVADDLLKAMATAVDDDRVMVGLMMDIYGDDERPRDRRRYLSQIEGHAEAALQRPGRILNFFGVHPDRPDTLDQLKRAVETKGFVGVKLYPSLSPLGPPSDPHGHPVKSEKMKDVYRYCIKKELPVLLHCGHGGFYRDKDTTEHCNPRFWEPILTDPEFEKLRVCFAHFGGHEALTDRGFDGAVTDDNWGAQIFQLMQDPKLNVYTDLAKHVAMFEDDRADDYFGALSEVIDAVGHKVLFGTDAWLLRLDMPYADYWAKWKAEAEKRKLQGRKVPGELDTVWDSITIAGPRSFLGFHGDTKDKWTKNLRDFVDYMADRRHSVGQAPADWLEAAVSEEFVAGRDAPSWNRHKQAVRNTYQFLGRYLTRPIKDRGFANNGEVRLRELTYFDPGDPNFAGHCRDMARRFVDFADQRVGYRAGHDFSSTVDLFIGAFRNGDLTLREVAMTIDSIVAYEESMS